MYINSHLLFNKSIRCSSINFLLNNVISCSSTPIHAHQPPLRVHQPHCVFINHIACSSTPPPAHQPHYMLINFITCSSTLRLWCYIVFCDNPTFWLLINLLLILSYIVIKAITCSSSNPRLHFGYRNCARCGMSEDKMEEHILGIRILFKIMLIPGKIVWKGIYFRESVSAVNYFQSIAELHVVIRKVSLGICVHYH